MAVHDVEIAAQARAWIDSARDRWRLQILARRIRVSSDGTRREVPSRIRRFVEGIPWAFVKPAVDYLLEIAPYEGVIANGVDFGVAYRPTLTVWQRDAQSAAVGAARPDATYTLVQDLVEFDSLDVYGFGTSSSCSESVETEFVWDAADVEGLPDGRQGVTYAMAAVHRNDDGTFDYQLVKRTALTQHVEETTVQDDMTKTVTHELWDNVYTDASGRYVDHSGAALDVPATGVSDGVSVRIEGLSENSDCTLKFQVVREASKPAEVRETCRKTVFEHEHGTVVSGSPSAPDHVDDAGGGVHREVDGQLQPDGTYMVTDRTTTELPQRSAVEYRRTTRSLVTTVTERNTPQQAREPLSPGERQSHEMTPGGLYNLTTVTAEPSATPDSARCAATVFEETHDAVTMTDALEPDAHGEAGGGRHSEVVQDMDEYGVVKRVDRVTTEVPVEVSLTETEVRLRGTSTTVVNRNMPAPAPESGLGVGDSVRNEMTPGGSWTQTIRKFTKAVAGILRRMCRKTIFRHVHATTENVGEDPGFVHVSESGDGTIREKDVQRMDDGTWDVTSTETTDIGVPAATTETRAYLDGTVTRTVNRNQPEKAPEAGLEVGDSVRNERTESGLWDQTIETAAILPTGETAEGCQRTNFVHTHSTTEGLGRLSAPPETEHTFLRGEIVEKRAGKTERGAWNLTTEIRTASPDSAYYTWADTEYNGRTRTVYRKGVFVYYNWQRIPTLEELPAYDGPMREETVADAYGNMTTRSVNPGWENVSYSVNINEFGLLDVRVSVGTFVSYEDMSYHSPGAGGMIYTQDLKVDKRGELWEGKVVVYRNAAGVVSSGFLKNAVDYPELGLRCYDNGTSGTKYYDFHRVA